MRFQSSSSSSSCYTLAVLLSVVTSGSADWTGSRPQSYSQGGIPRMQQQQAEIIQTINDKYKDEDNRVCIIDGDLSCTSTYYVYKEFRDGGATLAQAHAATGYDADLENCVLAPIYSYKDLLEISDAVPPCKAAYTAASKDPLAIYRESQACMDEGRIPFNCDFSSLGDALGELWGEDAAHHGTGGFGSCSLQEWFGDGDLVAGGQMWCPVLRQNWFNLGSKEAIPSEVWRAGDSSYCGEGPIQNAAAAFATDYTAGNTPTAALKAVNSGEYLHGAVYKCCQDVVTCYNDEE
uniref:Subtilisin n=1 Tax=Pseudo-nitzschia australis TaxID=44445 RepID=A0A7S4ELU5_9STRA|mmetsp:Transcript_9181/g.19883  ORF Transcript_9181/g.19883 Transcript_9181/m.19883 type:complete len:292 (+) Transcript_9181:149-1024(+)